MVVMTENTNKYIKVTTTSYYCKFGNFCEGFIFVTLQNDEIILSFADVVKSCPCCQFFYVANMSFNAIHEKKFHTKFFEFTVYVH